MLYIQSVFSSLKTLIQKRCNQADYIFFIHNVWRYQAIKDPFMFLEIFSLVIHVTFFAWCAYLIGDMFRNEPFFKVIKRIAPDLAFLTVIGAVFTSNHLVIIYCIFFIGTLYLALIFGKRIENWFQSKFCNAVPAKGSMIGKGTPKQTLLKKALSKPGKASAKLVKCDSLR